MFKSNTLLYAIYVLQLAARVITFYTDVSEKDLKECLGLNGSSVYQDYSQIGNFIAMCVLCKYTAVRT